MAWILKRGTGCAVPEVPSIGIGRNAAYGRGHQIRVQGSHAAREVGIRRRRHRIDRDLEVVIRGRGRRDAAVGHRDRHRVVSGIGVDVDGVHLGADGTIAEIPEVGVGIGSTRNRAGEEGGEGRVPGGSAHGGDDRQRIGDVDDDVAVGAAAAQEVVGRQRNRVHAGRSVRMARRITSHRRRSVPEVPEVVVGWCSAACRRRETSSHGEGAAGAVHCGRRGHRSLHHVHHDVIVHHYRLRIAFVGNRQGHVVGSGIVVGVLSFPVVTMKSAIAVIPIVDIRTDTPRNETAAVVELHHQWRVAVGGARAR